MTSSRKSPFLAIHQVTRTLHCLLGKRYLQIYNSGVKMVIELSATRRHFIQHCRTQQLEDEAWQEIRQKHLRWRIIHTGSAYHGDLVGSPLSDEAYTGVCNICKSLGFGVPSPPGFFDTPKLSQDPSSYWEICPSSATRYWFWGRMQWIGGHWIHYASVQGKRTTEVPTGMTIWTICSSRTATL